MSPDLHALGALLRARRVELGESLRQTARAVRRSPAWLSRVEGGHERPAGETLERLLLRLDIHDGDRDRAFAVAGIVPHALLAELLAHPERWSAVRAVLRGQRP